LLRVDDTAPGARELMECGESSPHSKRFAITVHAFANRPGFSSFDLTELDLSLNPN
jgi:hypothetical protein